MCQEDPASSLRSRVLSAGSVRRWEEAFLTNPGCLGPGEERVVAPGSWSTAAPPASEKRGNTRLRGIPPPTPHPSATSSGHSHFLCHLF